MGRYRVLPKYRVPYGSAYAGPGDIIEGNFEYARDKGWVEELDAGESEEESFPIEDYESKGANAIVPLLTGLSQSEVRAVLEREKKRPKPRKSIIKACWEQLQETDG